MLVKEARFVSKQINDLSHIYVNHEINIYMRKAEIVKTKASAHSKRSTQET